MSTINQSVPNRKRSRYEEEEMTAEDYERKIFMLRLFGGHLPYDTLLDWVTNDEEDEDDYGVLACFEEDSSDHEAKKRRTGDSPKPVELLWGGDEAGIRAFLDECMRDGEEEEKKEEEEEEEESEDEAEYFDAVEASSPAERSDEEEAFYDAEEDFINPL
ncbi:MAG: hypothetical protein EXX96DRAFT_610953 [Benjaminiella poitrasii]|nr:MAG: hypothetical protein EXX96DRAFT_610953 [Benjaminiella poitrasii]